MIFWPGATSELIVTSNVTVSVARRDPAPRGRIPAGTEPEHDLPGTRVELGRVVPEGIGRARRRLRTSNDAETARKYVEPAGIASRIAKLAAESEPVFVYDAV